MRLPVLAALLALAAAYDGAVVFFNGDNCGGTIRSVTHDVPLPPRCGGLVMMIPPTLPS